MSTSTKAQNRLAVVTGATGFIGYHLAKKLLEANWQVHLFVKPDSNTTRLGELPGSPHIYRYSSRITDLIEMMREARPDVVFHLASETLVTHEPEDIENLIRSNITFGTELLEAMAETGVRHFINTGTFWQYHEGNGYRPVNLYAATKQAFQDILRYYTECASIKALTLILFDVYGAADPRNKLFQQLEQVAQTGEPLLMSGGEQSLDLVYIDDVVEAYRHAADLLQESPDHVLDLIYAVSSGQHISLKQVVSIYELLIGSGLNIKWGGKPYRTREVMIPWKGKTLPGWKAIIDLESGITRMLSERNSKAQSKVEDLRAFQG